MIAAACLSMAINTIDVSAENHEPAYVTVKVSDGDTLWSIADQYMSGSKDQREAVYEIQQANNMSASDTLTAGTTIKVPSKE
jgi:LysM repeat protein